MKGIKKSIGIALSFVLLLSLSVTIIPLDLLHNHQFSQTVCKDAKGNTACNHKVHLNKKTDFCWVCAVHFDKTFTGTSLLEKIKLSPTISLFADNEITGYFIEHLFAALRGPPTK
jgi:hypothetical protein